MACLWYQHFPAAAPPPSPAASSPLPPPSPAASPPPPPLVLYKRCVVCPTCNASCLLKTVIKSAGNLNRQYVTCPNRTHKFYKWAEELKTDEFVDVPVCGGCSAGLCRVRRERSGPNAGRILFMCTIKEGEGSCGYRVWKDELEKSTPCRGDEIPQSPNELVNENKQSNERSRSRSRSNDGFLVTESSTRPQTISAERVTSFQPPSPTVNCIQTEPANKNTDFVEENNQSNEDANSESSRRAQRLSDIRTTLFPPLMVNSDQIEPANIDLFEEYNESSEGEDNELPLIDTSNPKCIGVTSMKTDLLNGQMCFPNELSSRKPHKRSRNRDLIDDEFTRRACDVSSPLDPTFTAQDDKTLANSGDLTTLSKILLGAETYNKPLLNPCHNPQLSRIEPKYSPTKTNIQNFMSKSISNAFGQAAEHLQNDFLAELVKQDVTNHKAMSLAAEVTFAALDCLLFDHRDFKRRTEEYIHCATSLAEIERSMAGDDSHQKLVEPAMDWVFQIEAELSCCEVEMRSMEGQLEKMRKKKEDLEDKYLTAVNELERSKELIERKEAERVAAKAAFERAKESLRG